MSPANPRTIILASASSIRRQLLEKAGLTVTALPARIDEETIRNALQAEAATPRDVADALAEMKARKLAEKHPDALVIGCDQVLKFDRTILAKPDSAETARHQLCTLRGKTHRLISAVVIYDRGEPIWRHTGVVSLTMREVSDTYLDEYLTRNWESVRHAVGAYMIEEEGVRLFSAIEGDYFTVLGLPLLPLLNYLGQRGFISV